MTALLYAGAFLFITGHIFSFMLEGSSGVAVTTLSAQITAAALYIPIASSAGFASSDTRVFIEDEEINYDSIQLGADANCASPPCLVLSSGDRGTNNTTAAVHASGIKVATEASGLLNQVVGFRTGQVDSVVGAVQFIFGNLFALAKFFAKLVMWDYSFLEGNGVYIKSTMLYPLSVAFVVALISIFREGFSAIFAR